jgi:hypothetical protein
VTIRFPYSTISRIPVFYASIEKEPNSIPKYIGHRAKAMYSGGLALCPLSSRYTTPPFAATTPYNKAAFLKLPDTAPRQKDHSRNAPIQRNPMTIPARSSNADISDVPDGGLVPSPPFLKVKRAWARRVERVMRNKPMMASCHDSLCWAVRGILNQHASSFGREVFMQEMDLKI